MSIFDRKLVLSDGSVWLGTSFGADLDREVETGKGNGKGNGKGQGEVVFTTSMVGYPESLTDPSYLDQLLVLTYPLVGNYGVPDEKQLDENGLSKYFESSRIHANGLIVADYVETESHWQSKKSLDQWLSEQGVPGISGIDTRALTLHIRTKGVMKGWIVHKNTVTTVEGCGVGWEDVDKNELHSDPGMISRVSCQEITSYGSGDKTILVVDLGIKQHMIRSLLRYNMKVVVVPWNYDFSSKQIDWDGLFLSNGPGDPTHPECLEVVERLKTVINRTEGQKPVFAICLGHQLLALASGAKTVKMKFGHRSMNQPCLDTRTGQCYITSQNHGYCVDNDSLTKGWKPLFVNVNDHTNEGLIHQKFPYFSVQFHPEARGGPPDTGFLFDMFAEKIREPQYQKVVIRKVHNSLGKPVYHRVLLLGSGGLSIGQAGEFD